MTDTVIAYLLTFQPLLAVLCSQNRLIKERHLSLDMCLSLFFAQIDESQKLQCLFGVKYPARQMT